MSIDDLTANVGEWLRGNGPMADIVMSSRIRLARNLTDYPFLSRTSEDQQREVFRALADAFSESGVDKNLLFFDLEELDEIEKQVLVERHLISQQHANSSGSRGVAVSPSETQALMINEEDHLRMQVLRSGLELVRLWSEISSIDDSVGEQIDFAYDNQLGFLTACPTNVGTGLRVSVMLHLPALKITGEIDKVLRAAKDLRLAVRGLFGEGTDAVGDFYQISNQITLGRPEEDIIEEFSERIIPRIVEYENAARDALASERSSQLDDKIWRAYGILENARTLASDEAMFLLSHVRMGVAMKRIDKIDMGTINEMMLQIQPAHLQKLHGKSLTGEERSIARATLVRKQLARHENN